MKLMTEIKNPCLSDIIKILREKLECFGFKEQERTIHDNTIIFLRSNYDESEDYVCFHTNNLSIETDNLCFAMSYGDIDIIDIDESFIKLCHGNIMFQIKK